MRDAGAVDPRGPTRVRHVRADRGSLELVKAVVHFTVYTVASSAGGKCHVKIPYRMLKPLLQPGAVVG
jgi:hypothetical protein